MFLSLNGSSKVNDKISYIHNSVPLLPYLSLTLFNLGLQVRQVLFYFLLLQTLQSLLFAFRVFLHFFVFAFFSGALFKDSLQPALSVLPTHRAQQALVHADRVVLVDQGLKRTITILRLVQGGKRI